MGVFSTCVIALDLTTSVSFKKKVEIKKKIIDSGGIVSFIVTKKTTHVVGNDPEKFDVSSKCRMAVKYSIPVVSPEFITDAIKSGKLPNTDEYIIGGRSKTSDFKSGKISAGKPNVEEKKKKKKSVFSIKGVKVWQHGDNRAPEFDEVNYEVAKYAVLEGFDKKLEVKTFYVLEIHVNDVKDKNSESMEYRFRVYTHHGSVQDAQEGYMCTRECRYAKTSDEVLAIFGNVHKEQMQPMKKMKDITGRRVARNIGSQKLQKILAELPSTSHDLDPRVADLVEHIWREVAGEVTEIIATTVDRIKTEQLEKAEAVLLKIQECLTNNKKDELDSLAKEFYGALPHKNQDEKINKQWVATKLDLCQLIRDMISVNEATNWSTRSSAEAKYRALRCNIGYRGTEDSEQKMVRDLVESSLEGDLKMEIQTVFEIQRPIEETNFRHDLDPKRLLFHASKTENFVGILSRGLLLPKVVVEDFGGTRTDAGMLGSGLYFASAASTSAKYSSASKTKGTRLMLVSEVALGQCKELYNYNTTLRKAPEGYHSVHGVKRSDEVPSDFQEDEYAIYSINQQRLRYLVEFTLEEDVTKEIYPADVEMEAEEDSLADRFADSLDLSDVVGVEDPLLKVKAGLVSDGDKTAVKLEGVHIRAKLVDLAAQVIVLQEYYNRSSFHIEAKYVFPLDDMAAVCGFEAFINGKHIVGEVKEKEQAHKEYKQAVKEGHGAYLMDRDEETPDVFTVSVGNLPPDACVLIKITYVAELQVEAELISFRLPGSVAPWKQDSATNEITQTELETHKVSSGETTVQVAVEMPFDIHSIQCPSHKVRVKRTASKAVVEMKRGQSIQDGFHLLVGLAEIHVPRMWVEKHPTKDDHQACMLTFYPEFEADEQDEVEVLFVLDLSNSMAGDAALDAKKVLMMCIRSLSPNSSFNVICFGTTYREVFPTCQPKTDVSVQAVEKFLKTAMSDMGNTEVFKPLHSYHLLAPETSVRNVFIISDGHFNNEDAVLNSIINNMAHTRVFTLGVSGTANMHLLRGVARVGGGAFEFFDRKAKSKWERKVKSQLSKASQPGLTSVSVEWQQFDSDPDSLAQAPRQITALFNGSRQVVYGFVPNCTMATLKAVVGGQEVSTVVSTSDLNITTGEIVHRLTARALIRDWEDGMLSSDRTQHEILKMNLKTFVIELSKDYSLVTQFTSFVAIETRDEDEKKGLKDFSGPSMSELVSDHSMDILTYVSWEKTKEEKEKERDVADESKTLEEALEMFEKVATHDFQAFLRRDETLKTAIENSSCHLSPTHPTLLKAYTVLVEELSRQGKHDQALSLANKAFDDAVCQLDTLAEDSYKDATLLLQKLNDEITKQDNNQESFAVEISSKQEQSFSSDDLMEELCALEDESLDQQLLECSDLMSAVDDSGADYSDNFFCLEGAVVKQDDSKKEIEEKELQQEIDGVAEIMKSNIDSILERGMKMTDLEVKSADLELQGARFYKSSRRASLSDSEEGELENLYAVMGDDSGLQRRRSRSRDRDRDRKAMPKKLGGKFSGKLIATKAARVASPESSSSSSDLDGDVWDDNMDDEEEEGEQMEIANAIHKPSCLSKEMDTPKPQLATKAARKSAPATGGVSYEEEESESDEDMGFGLFDDDSPALPPPPPPPPPAETKPMAKKKAVLETSLKPMSHETQSLVRKYKKTAKADLSSTFQYTPNSKAVKLLTTDESLAVKPHRSKLHGAIGPETETEESIPLHSTTGPPPTDPTPPLPPPPPPLSTQTKPQTFLCFDRATAPQTFPSYLLDNLFIKEQVGPAPPPPPPPQLQALSAGAMFMGGSLSQPPPPPPQPQAFAAGSMFMMGSLSQPPPPPPLQAFAAGAQGRARGGPPPAPPRTMAGKPLPGSGGPPTASFGGPPPSGPPPKMPMSMTFGAASEEKQSVRSALLQSVRRGSSLKKWTPTLLSAPVEKKEALADISSTVCAPIELSKQAKQTPALDLLDDMASEASVQIEPQRGHRWGSSGFSGQSQSFTFGSPVPSGPPLIHPMMQPVSSGGLFGAPSPVMAQSYATQPPPASSSAASSMDIFDSAAPPVAHSAYGGFGKTVTNAPPPASQLSSTSSAFGFGSPAGSPAFGSAPQSVSFGSATMNASQSSPCGSATMNAPQTMMLGSQAPAQQQQHRQQSHVSWRKADFVPLFHQQGETVTLIESDKSAETPTATASAPTVSWRTVWAPSISQKGGGLFENPQQGAEVDMDTSESAERWKKRKGKRAKKCEEEKHEIGGFRAVCASSRTLDLPVSKNKCQLSEEDLQLLSRWDKMKKKTLKSTAVKDSALEVLSAAMMEEEFGIGMSVPCVRQQRRGLRIIKVEHVIMLQKQGAFWEFGVELDSDLGIDSEACREILFKAGLKSLVDISSSVCAPIELSKQAKQTPALDLLDDMDSEASVQIEPQRGHGWGSSGFSGQSQSFTFGSPVPSGPPLIHPVMQPVGSGGLFGAPSPVMAQSYAAQPPPASSSAASSMDIFDSATPPVAHSAYRGFGQTVTNAPPPASQLSSTSSAFGFSSPAGGHAFGSAPQSMSFGSAAQSLPFGSATTNALQSMSFGSATMNAPLSVPSVMKAPQAMMFGSQAPVQQQQEQQQQQQQQEQQQQQQQQQQSHVSWRQSTFVPLVHHHGKAVTLNESDKSAETSTATASAPTVSWRTVWAPSINQKGGGLLDKSEQDAEVDMDMSESTERPRIVEEKRMSKKNIDEKKTEKQGFKAVHAPITVFNLSENKKQLSEEDLQLFSKRDEMEKQSTTHTVNKHGDEVVMSAARMEELGIRMSFPCVRQRRKGLQIVQLEEEFGIGMSVPCVRQRHRRLRIVHLEHVITLQKPGAFWEFGVELDSDLGIDSEACREILFKAGLKSLGMTVADDILHLIATALVIMSIMEILCPELFPLSVERLLKLGKDEEDILPLRNQMEKMIASNNMNEEKIFQAMKDGFYFCNEMDKKYPLVCKSLELGSNWVDVSAKMLGVQTQAQESMVF